MIYLPIIGAFLEAVGVTIEKKTLRKQGINYKNYTTYSFLAIVLVMLPFIYFFWNLEPEGYLVRNILLFSLVVILSIIANILIFYALKRENLSEIEPIRLMQPLFTVLLAFVFSFFFSAYSSEKNFIILGLALIASASLVFSHFDKKYHLVYDKYMIAALAGSFLFASELVISRAILPYYHPFTFYFLRSLSVFLIAFIMFRPSLSSIPNKNKFLIFIVGPIWVVYRVILYYGYLNLGIIFTTILFILAPVFIYTFARIFLKEKITWKQVVSSIVIVACVIAAIITEM